MMPFSPCFTLRPSSFHARQPATCRASGFCVEIKTILPNESQKKRAIALRDTLQVTSGCPASMSWAKSSTPALTICLTLLDFSAVGGSLYAAKLIGCHDEKLLGFGFEV